MRQVTKHRKLAGLFLMLLFFKALLPLGVMPSFSSQKGFSLEICQGSNLSLSPEAEKIQRELAVFFGDGEQDHPAEGSSGEICVFAAYSTQHIVLLEGGIYKSLQRESNRIVIENEAYMLRNITASALVRGPPLSA